MEKHFKSKIKVKSRRFGVILSLLSNADLTVHLRGDWRGWEVGGCIGVCKSADPCLIFAKIVDPSICFSNPKPQPHPETEI